MTYELDVELIDAELRDEIRLVSDLMIAAVETTGPMDQAVIDAILAKSD